MGADAPVRWLLPFVAIASLAREGRALGSAGAAAPLLASLYGGVALAVLCLVGRSRSRARPCVATPAATLWAAALCAVAVERAAAASIRARFARVAPSLEVGALGLLGGLTAASAWRAFTLGPEAPTLAAAVLVAALCAGVFARAAERHPAARHIALPATSLLAALIVRALTPTPGHRAAAVALPAAALAAVAARAPHGRPRTVTLRWGAFLWGGGDRAERDERLSESAHDARRGGGARGRSPRGRAGRTVDALPRRGGRARAGVGQRRRGAPARHGRRWGDSNT